MGRINFIKQLYSILVSLAVFFSLISITSCNKTTSVSVDPKMVKLFADLELAEISWAEQPDRILEMRKTILNQHHVSSTDFSQYLAGLHESPQIWESFLDSVSKRASELEKIHQGE